MLWIPHKGDQLIQHNLGSVATTSPGTSVTTGASSNTKGTPVEIFSATNFDAYGVLIQVSGLGENTFASDAAIDVLAGAATEEIIISDILCGGAAGGGATNSAIPREWYFPLYIPSGTRIAVQAASRRTAFAMRVGIHLFGGNGIPPHPVGGKVTTYGMGTVPNGTAIIPGASGAEGAFTQITASTTSDHFALIPSFQITNDTSQSMRSYQVDLGVGVATEEEAFGGWWFFSSSAETLAGPSPAQPVFKHVPTGTRLALRASCNGALDAGYDAVIHAVG